MVSSTIFAAVALILCASGSVLSPVQRNLSIFDPSTNIQITDLTPKTSTGNKLKIVKEGLNVISDRQTEDVEFAVDSTESGYARVTAVGLSVTAGASATLDFDISVRAIDAQTLENSDGSFVGTLSEAEREEYERTTTTYSGGLDVSWLKWIGVDLDAKTEKIDMERSAEMQGDYNLKARAAREILESTAETNLQISGTLTATGVSSIPTTVFAFIKLARVELQDGTTKTVVTSDDNDLVAATEDGSVVPSEGGQIDIIEL